MIESLMTHSPRAWVGVPNPEPFLTWHLVLGLVVLFILLERSLHLFRGQTTPPAFFDTIAAHLHAQDRQAALQYCQSYPRLAVAQLMISGIEAAPNGAEATLGALRYRQLELQILLFRRIQLLKGLATLALVLTGILYVEFIGFPNVHTGPPSTPEMTRLFAAFGVSEALRLVLPGFLITLFCWSGYTLLKARAETLKAGLEAAVQWLPPRLALESLSPPGVMRELIRSRLAQSLGEPFSWAGALSPLTIVAMMMMVTTLYLVQYWPSPFDPRRISPDTPLYLPLSTVQIYPPLDAHTEITLNLGGVWVDKERVTMKTEPPRLSTFGSKIDRLAEKDRPAGLDRLLPDLAYVRGAPAQFQAGGETLEQALTKRIAHWRQLENRGGRAFDGRLFVFADKDTPYHRLAQVLEVSQRVGFGSFGLVVMGE